MLKEMASPLRSLYRWRLQETASKWAVLKSNFKNSNFCRHQPNKLILAQPVPKRLSFSKPHNLNFGQFSSSSSSHRSSQHHQVKYKLNSTSNRLMCNRRHNPPYQATDRLLLLEPRCQVRVSWPKSSKCFWWRRFSSHNCRWRTLQASLRAASRRFRSRNTWPNRRCFLRCSNSSSSRSPSWRPETGHRAFCRRPTSRRRTTMYSAVSNQSSNQLHCNKQQLSHLRCKSCNSSSSTSNTKTTDNETNTQLHLK